MANNTVYSESVVTLNATQAQATMDALKSQADSLRQKMIEATKVGDVEGAKKYQKELDAVNKSMSSINRETKDYSKLLNNLNGASLNELQKAAKGLESQIKKLKPGTQEFIDKTKQLKEVRLRIADVNKDIKGSQSQLGGFFKKIGWTAIIAAAIKAFKSFATTLIQQTQSFGDKWQAETAGMKASYNSLIVDISKGTGWRELIANMKSAYETGKEVAQMLDELFERQNSLSMQEAEYRVEIEKAKQTMRDVTKTNEERLAAAELVATKEEELAKMRQDIAAQELAANKKTLQDRTKMTDEDLDYMVRYYNKNRDCISEAIEYNNKLRDLEGRAASERQVRNYEKAEEYEQEIAALKAQTSEEAKAVAERVKMYDLSNDEMVKAYVESYTKMYDAEANYYSATTRSVTTAASLRKQMAQEAAKAQEDSYNRAVAAADERNAKLLNGLKASYAAGEISAEEYEKRKTELAEQGLQEKLAIAQRYRKSTVAIEGQILDMSVAEQKAFDKEVQQIADGGIKAMTDRINKVAQFLKKKADEEAAENKRLQDLANDLTGESRKLMFQSEMHDLESMYERKMLTEEQFQQKKAEMIAKYEQQQRESDMESWQSSIESAQKYLNQIGEAMNNLQTAKMAALETQMQQELRAAGDNADKREEIEQRYEQRKLEIEKRYADVNMGIQIAQALANGASAIVATFAQLGMTPAGIAAAAAMAVVTATQVATLIAQRNAIRSQSAATSSSSSGATTQRTVTGYSTGGYTERAASDYQEVGVVHANEWVAPAAMVRANPVMFRQLEAMRQQSAHRSGVAGFADGGPTSGSMAAAQGQVTDLSALIAAVNGLKSQPIKAYVVNSELNAAQELDAKIKSIAGKR